MSMCGSNHRYQKIYEYNAIFHAQFAGIDTLNYNKEEKKCDME